MLEKIKLSVTSVPFAGEHRAKDIVIEGLERIPDALYYMEVQSTDGKNYEIKIPEDAESVPIDGSMAPLEGFLKVMLLCKSAAGDVIEKSKTENFRIHAALMNDGEILPDYKTVKNLAEKILAVPEQIQEFVGTIEEVQAAGEAANEAAARAEQAADGVVADGAVTGVKLSNTITNLFNPAECTVGVTIEDISGTEVENADFMITGYIPCVASNVYYCPGGNRRRGIWYNANKEPVAYNNYGHYAGSGEITAPAGAAYFRLSYGITPYNGVDGCDIERFMVTYGGNGYPAEYIPYGGTVANWLYTPVKDDSVTTDKLAAKAVTADKLGDKSVGTEQLKNEAVTVANIAGVITNYLDLCKCTPERLSHVDGTVTDDADYFTSPYIEFPRGEMFSCPLGENRCVCFYDDNKQFLSSQTTSGWSDQHDITAMPDGAKYLRVSYSTSGFDVWNPMLVNGSVYPDKYIKPTGTTLSWLDSNPLQGKKLAVLGDSICALHKSYINTVAYQNNMDFDRAAHNQSVWGSPVARHTYADKPESFVERFSLLRDDVDYLVIHGGANDGFLGIPIGDVTAMDDFTGNVDEYTFCGALESLFRQAQAKYSDAIIIFVLTYKLLNIPHQADYISAARRVCDKYSVPVLDLYGCSGINIGIPAMREKYFMDDTHYNGWGHLRIADMVERFLLDYSTPQPQCVENTNQNNTVQIKWKFINVEKTPSNKPISVYVKQPTQLTLKSARGGYLIQYKSPTDITVIKAFGQGYNYTTKNAENEDNILSLNNLELGKWDYITDKTNLVRYSSDMINIAAQGNWIYTGSVKKPNGSTIYTVKADIAALGITDIYTPVSDDDECPIVLGPHEMVAGAFSYADFSQSDCYTRSDIAVNDGFLFVKSEYLGLNGKSIGDDVTDIVQAFLAGPYGYGFYRKANAVSRETIEPVVITAYPYVDYFLKFDSTMPPCVNKLLDFGVQTIPDMPRIMIDGKAYDASGTGVIDLTQVIKDMIAKYK